MKGAGDRLLLEEEKNAGSSPKKNLEHLVVAVFEPARCGRSLWPFLGWPSNRRVGLILLVLEDDGISDTEADRLELVPGEDRECDGVVASGVIDQV